MRYSASQKSEARKRLLAAAGRAFRRQGFGGIGVDGLAKEAGVTSGAFYGHFKSKDAAFEEVAVAGLELLDQTIARFQLEHPEDWAERFIDFYLGDRLTCALDESCALQSLTGDVMRAGRSTREQYELRLQKIVERVAEGLHDLEPELRSGRALALLSLLSGGVTLLRSTANDDLRLRIAEDLALAARALLARPA